MAISKKGFCSAVVIMCIVSNWANMNIHQQVIVQKETDLASKVYDPYCCKSTINRTDRIGPVTVGYIPRELPRFVYFFIHEGGSVTGILSSLRHRVSPIAEGGLEIPIQMTFSHSCKEIIAKMKTYLEKQIAKMGEIFLLDGEINDDDEVDEVEDVVMVEGDCLLVST